MSGKAAPKPAGAAGPAGARKGGFRLRQKCKKALALKKQKQRVFAGKLRSSITPGTVLILLSSGYRGKRVICLKQLQPSGLLLVTGPFKVNGVPLRRVNPRYVIATSTKVDLSGMSGVLNDSDLLKDEMFQKNRRLKEVTRRRAQNANAELFVHPESAGAKSEVSKERFELQNKVDAFILNALKNDQLLTQYLKTRFTLRANMAPHAMKF